MLTITTTAPDGTSVTDNRPGHTVPGLAYTLDPFQRRQRVPITRVAFNLSAHLAANQAR